MLIPGTNFQLLPKNAVSIWSGSTTYLQNAGSPEIVPVASANRKSKTNCQFAIILQILNY